MRPRSLGSGYSAGSCSSAWRVSPALHAAQRALDLLEGATGAELHEVADRRGLRHGLAVGADVHVDLDVVARLRLALDRRERRGLLAQALHLGVDLLAGDFASSCTPSSFSSAGSTPLGPQRELCGERERLAFGRHGLEIHARAIGRVQAGLGDRLADPRGRCSRIVSSNTSSRPCAAAPRRAAPCRGGSRGTWRCGRGARACGGDRDRRAPARTTSRRARPSSSIVVVVLTGSAP